MARPISKTTYTGETTDKALTAKLIEISKNNPKNAVMAYGHFGTITIYVYKSLSAIPVGSAAASAMLFTTGGLAYVNGKLTQPTAKWNEKNNLAKFTNCDH